MSEKVDLHQRILEVDNNLHNNPWAINSNLSYGLYNLENLDKIVKHNLWQTLIFEVLADYGYNLGKIIFVKWTRAKVRLVAILHYTDLSKL